jgi:hypothetical protein
MGMPGEFTNIHIKMQLCYFIHHAVHQLESKKEATGHRIRTLQKVDFSMFLFCDPGVT